MFKPYVVRSAFNYYDSYNAIQDSKKEIEKPVHMPTLEEKKEIKKIQYLPGERLLFKLRNKEKKDKEKEIIQNSINNVLSSLS